MMNLYEVRNDRGRVGYFTAPGDFPLLSLALKLAPHAMTAHLVGEVHAFSTPEALLSYLRPTRPCRNCSTPTDHPLEVCSKCYRDPETNACGECKIHSPGIPYPYICGFCISGIPRP